VGTVSHTNTNCVLEQVNENGGAALPAANQAWALEADIDIDMVSAICPNCQLLVVESSSASISDLGTGVNTAVSMGALVVSNSYGVPEYATEASDAATYFDHPGVAIVAAAGDTGYGVDFPAADPNVIAVGGTELLQRNATGTRAGTETAWNGTTSGCSAYEPKPAWQIDTGCANRSVADVAADADPLTGVWVYDSFHATGLMVAAGTSVATPIIGALFAVANASFPSAVYPVAYLYQGRSSLLAVTSGTNGNCGSYLCNASLSVAGYNGPTGLGTPGASPNSARAFNPTALAAHTLAASTATKVGTSNTATGATKAHPGRSGRSATRVAR
jgi:subtilase family serine protease